MSSIWPVLHYDDATTALRFLVEVFGFHEVLAVTDEDGDIAHAEVSWPGGGCLVFGSTKHTDSVHGAMKSGASAVYVITGDVDAVHNRVLRAGDATVVRAPNNTQFGSGADTYAFTAADPEGNLWTFGTYTGTRRGL
ncbi:glyoxalase [Mycolicibacterium moriokaense]|nr:glyoxalase [Mycolicibacterium moriokaense]